MIKIGINGFGRIGRVICRIIDQSNHLSVVAINDINPDIQNINYLHNYDTTYGPLSEKTYVDNNKIINQTGSFNCSVYCESKISKVPWNERNVDIVIDSSGVNENLILAKDLCESVKKVIVTNSPDISLVDNTIIYGVNEKNLDFDNDFLIASSICDATALTTLLGPIDDQFNIENGFVTTLHPWLGYQNLLDGPSKSYAVPGEIIDNYALGRSSPMTIIPKNTSAVTASYKILPKLKNRFSAHSYRVPTNIVSSADVTLRVEKEINENILVKFLTDFQVKNSSLIFLNEDALVSTDFIKSTYSAIVDMRFLHVSDNYIRMMIWYDNEWGYSSRVVDLVDYISKKIA
tara:strand:- start:339 stop:1379 length:1041 start_codon:yes stop_codon:yes gene_type:complete